MKHICIYCRTVITKTGTNPYICRNCEALIRNEEANEKFIYISGEL